MSSIIQVLGSCAVVKNEEYKKAEEIMGYFIENCKQRMCDGYLDCAKDCAIYFIDSAMPTFSDYGYGISAYWSAVKYYIQKIYDDYDTSL